jgi:hypothetical protein
VDFLVITNEMFQCFSEINGNKKSFQNEEPIFAHEVKGPSPCRLSAGSAGNPPPAPPATPPRTTPRTLFVTWKKHLSERALFKTPKVVVQIKCVKILLP